LNDKINSDRIGTAFTMHGMKRDAYSILVAKPEGRNHYKDLNVDGA
jgi:hypothetical protein